MAVTRMQCRFLAWLLVATLAPAQAAPALAQQPPARPRPRIGLALSGGGARGAAHIGVLKVLEELRVPVDYVAGTSMGALVGGLYSTGMTPAELERVITEVDWSKAFADKIPREDRSFRRKRDDDLYLVKNKPGLDGLKLRFPPGMIDGQRIDLLLKRNTLPVVTVRDFDGLAIPYRAVAADIVNGEAVVLERGDLALAMRASMAIPTVFAPREIDGRLLVDGGIRQNLPIDVVRAMGAQVVIAVDISTPPMGREGLNSVISIATQLTTFASQNDIQRQIGSLKAPDVFIRPDLGTITVASFDRAVDAIPVGVTGARGVRAALENLSVSPEEYRAHLAARPRRAEPPVIHEVRVVNRSRLADGVIAARMKAETGVPLDPDRLEKVLDQIYGLELFESVYYDVTREADRNVLTVTAQECAWGPNYVQAGVAAFEDFETPDFNVALAYTRTAINRLSGEWRTGFQVGRDPGIFTELYQPVDRGLRKFVHVRLSASDQAVNQFNGAGDKVAEFEMLRRGVEAAVGRELGTWGEVRTGILREAGEIGARVGAPDQPDRHFDTGEAFAQFYVDRLDDVSFPRFGSTLRARLTGGWRGLGSDAHYAQTLVEASTARTFGRYTGYVSGFFGTTTEGETPAQSLFRLGGLTRLSGLERQELGGQHAALASAVFYRRFEVLSVVPVYAGCSAEYGNAFRSRGDIRLDRGILSGSVLAGVSTFLGPICAAFGWAEGGRTNYYLTLGETLYRQRGGLGDR